MRARRWTTGSALVLALTLAPLALAGPYPPPSEGKGTIEPSRIRPGECAVFSGDGFAPRTAITVTDNDAAAGSTHSNADGAFAKRLCFGADATRGRHTLRGTGDAAPAAAQALGLLRLSSAAAADRRTVTAVLTITGVAQSHQTSGGVSGGAVTSLPRTDDGLSGLPFTGLPALALSLAGTLLVAVGSFVLLATERRARRSRRLRRAG